MTQKYNYTKKTGRPTSYLPEYCQEIIKFFDRPKTERVIKSVITGKNEYEKTEYQTVPNEIPFFSSFCRKIGHTESTLLEWCKHFPEFSKAYNASKELQKEFLITNGLCGLYPPAAYIFTAKNITDMRDKTEIVGSISIREALKQDFEKRKGLNK